MLFSMSSARASGSGTLKGRVFDRATKDPLIGATIVVKNTSIGAATDLNGYFIVRNVPAGNSVIVIRCIGYDSVNATVTLEQNGEVSQDYYLNAVAIQGKPVLVTAQAQGQVQAVNQQLSSSNIVNVVSAKKIQELPDFNAAEALGRLPGISVTRSGGEADRIVIRGLAPEYNLVAINGVTQGATDNSTRSVDLNQISPNMIKSIEVYKELTPDMDADAIGGFVNILLNDAPHGFHTDLLWQSGYNKFRNFYGNYKAVASVSDRFFDDQLGAYLLLTAEEVDRSADNINATYNVIGAQNVVFVETIALNRHIEFRNRYGGSLMLDYRIPNGSIQLTNSFSRLQPRTTDFTTTYDPPWNGAGQQLYNITGGVSNNDIMTNSLEGKNDLGFMQVEYGVSNNYVLNNTPSSPQIQFLQTNGWVPSLNSVVGAGMSPQTLVTYAVPNDLNIALSQIGTNVYMFKNVSQAGKLDLKIPFAPSEDLSGFLKFGGKYSYTDRHYDETEYSVGTYYGGDQAIINDIFRLFPNLKKAFLGGASGGNVWALNFTNPDPTLWQNFLPNQRVGDLNWAPTLGYPNQVSMAFFNDKTNSDLTVQNALIPINGAEGLYWNDYSYIEILSAGYGMAQVNGGQHFMIVGGARFENDANNITAYAVKQQSVMQPAYNQDTINAKTSNHYWLPMVQARYKVTDWADIRYAYTQTLARPDFNALVPKVQINSPGNYAYLGNPFLKSARAYNHDLILSLYSNVVGLFTVDGFYKEIDGFAYQRYYPLLAHPPSHFDSLTSTVGGYTLRALGIGTTGSGNINDWINNPYPAFLRGVEVDLEHRFWYLPFPFSGIVLSTNYSHIWSNTFYPIISSKSVGKTVIILPDSSRSDRLVQQPSDIFNGSLGYDLGGFSARVSFEYYGSVLTYIGGVVQNDNMNQDYFRLDASVRYQLQQDSFMPGLQVYVNLNNLTARPDQGNQVSKGYIQYENFYGFTADVGIRYTL